MEAVPTWALAFWAHELLGKVLPTATGQQPAKATVQSKAVSSWAWCLPQPTRRAQALVPVTQHLFVSTRSHPETTHPDPGPSPCWVSLTLLPSQARLPSRLPQQVRSPGQALPLDFCPASAERATGAGSGPCTTLLLLLNFPFVTAFLALSF